MRKWSMILTCSRCGKSYKAVFGDAIMPEDLQRQRNPLCKKCQMISRIHSFLTAQEEEDA